MAFATLLYEWKEVDAAGKDLATQRFPLRPDESLRVINNWRSSHSYILNTFQTTLRNKAKKIENDITVAQRIKRLESIHAKLSRFKSMRMTQMQDIAGCRVVFKDMSSVTELVKRYRTSRFDHVLKRENDYIAIPKKDGYRCYHLVYEYKGEGPTETYDRLRVEIQIRTQIQHAWATAVEAVGIFTKQALKSNQGDADWIRFFALMGSAIAAIEGTSPVPETPTTKKDLVSEVKRLSDKLRVIETLSAYNATLQATGTAKDAKYFLLQLDPETQKIQLKRYRASDSQVANDEYTHMEANLAEGSAVQVALVSTDSITALRRAYPNYFLDTNLFVDLVRKVLKGAIPAPAIIAVGKGLAQGTSSARAESSTSFSS